MKFINYISIQSCIGSQFSFCKGSAYTSDSQCRIMLSARWAPEVQLSITVDVGTSVTAREWAL